MKQLTTVHRTAQDQKWIPQQIKSTGDNYIRQSVITPTGICLERRVQSSSSASLEAGSKEQVPRLTVLNTGFHAGTYLLVSSELAPWKPGQ